MKLLDYLIFVFDGIEFMLYVNKIKLMFGCYIWGYKIYLKGRELGFIECIKNNDGYWVVKRK